MAFDPTLFVAIAGDIALTLAAAALGMMLFFGAVVAPTVFRRFDRDVAGALIRALFPHYYLSVGVLALFGAAAAVPASRFATVLLFLTAVAFLWLRQSLLPRIDAARAKSEDATDGDEAGARFKRLHRMSVRINMVQLAMVIGAVVVLIGY